MWTHFLFQCLSRGAIKTKVYHRSSYQSYYRVPIRLMYTTFWTMMYFFLAGWVNFNCFESTECECIIYTSADYYWFPDGFFTIVRLGFQTTQLYVRNRHRRTNIRPYWWSCRTVYGVKQRFFSSTFRVFENQFGRKRNIMRKMYTCNRSSFT